MYIRNGCENEGISSYWIQITGQHTMEVKLFVHYIMDAWHRSSYTHDLTLVAQVLSNFVFRSHKLRWKNVFHQCILTKMEQYYGNEEFCPLGCNAIYSVESQSTFWRNIFSLSSGLKNKLSMKPAWEQLVSCLANSLTMKIKATHFSEISADFQ